MISDRLKNIIGSHSRTVLNPVGFFVARSGVLTLAFEGFCNSVLDIKREIAELDSDLSPEYEGSRWPKTSLAALRHGSKLEMPDIVQLYSLCHSWDDHIRREAQPLEVSYLHVVEYECRSLERTKSQIPIELLSDVDGQSDFLPDWHLKSVDDVLAQFNVDNLSTYAEQIQHSGNDERHYRQHSSGTTLVIKPNMDGLRFVQTFRDEVERILPNRYAWFDEDSLHITVRNLND